MPRDAREGEGVAARLCKLRQSCVAQDIWLEICQLSRASVRGVLVRSLNGEYVLVFSRVLVNMPFSRRGREDPTDFGHCPSTGAEP